MPTMEKHVGLLQCHLEGFRVSDGRTSMSWHCRPPDTGTCSIRMAIWKYLKAIEATAHRPASGIRIYMQYQSKIGSWVCLSPAAVVHHDILLLPSLINPALLPSNSAAHELTPPSETQYSVKLTLSRVDLALSLPGNGC